MKNAVITMSFLLLCFVLGVMLYIYWPEATSKRYEEQIKVLIIKDLEDNLYTADSRLKGIIEELEEVETIKELEELKELYE